MRALRAAAAATALAATILAPPARASACTAVTGSLVHPTWLLDLSPGLWSDPQPQALRLSTNGGFSLVSRAGYVSFGCVSAAGTSASYTGYMWFDPSAASGASFAPEDVVSGAGRVDGIDVTGYGFAGTSVTTRGGAYDLRPRLSATASLSYVRAAASITVVLVLAGTSVDVDGDGPLPAQDWGTVVSVGAAPLDENPFWISYDLRDHGRITFVSFEPAITAISTQ